MGSRAAIGEVRAIGKALSNWGRWGPEDQLGTLNLITPESRRRAAAAVRTGEVVSLAIALDETGPQLGSPRFNPIHFMVRDGGDILSGADVRDYSRRGNRDYHSTDDVVIMPLQAGTHWDALAHVVDSGLMYNGFGIDQISSRGAHRNSVAGARDRLVGRGVLLDVARARGKTWLDNGEPITRIDLDECVRRQGVTVASGDILLIRTGRMARVAAEGGWGGFQDASLGAAGLSLDTALWLKEHDIAAVATDTLAVEVLPEDPSPDDVLLPLHIVCLVYLGMMLGEIFDLETLATRCAAAARFDFLLASPTLPFTRAVGSPVNPIAIL